MTSHLWALRTGAQLDADQSVRFTLWAPHVRRPRVRVVTGAAAGDYPMVPLAGERGVVSVVVPGVAAGDDYLFVVDDGRALPDPASRWQPFGVHGASRVVDPLEHQWSDIWWRGLPMDELVMYELHVGTFTPEGTFDAVIPRLADLKSLGVSAIALMPVAQFPGDRNWGYDGVDLFAVQHSYGGPAALRRLVDAAHGHGLGVILDVVYNHVGPEGNYLPAFGPYFSERYRTPWGPALNFDGPGSDAVRQLVVDNARYWVTEYHIDGLRLDAVHQIYDMTATHLLEEIAVAVHARGAALARSVVVIGESDLNDPKLLRPASEQGYGLDGQWADDFHHAVHAALTGDSASYYADFGGASVIADAMREPFVYDGRYSVFRGRTHGRASVGIPSSRFVVALQNHDQVGNRPGSRRLASLVQPDQLRLAAALLLLSPYVPLLFMGEEYAETSPFHFFVSHDDVDLQRAVRDGRRRELLAAGWQTTIPDPSDDATFLESRIDWARRDQAGHLPVLALYRDLLAIRREEPLMRPDHAILTVANGAPGWITLLRESFADGSSFDVRLLALFNCTADPVDIPLPAVGAHVWSLRLSTDAVGYGGDDRIASTVDAIAGTDGPRRLLDPGGPTVRLPPWSAALYQESLQESLQAAF